MPFAAVLDTCVLYPAHLRDTLLRLGERELYIPLWSEEILGELSRNLAGSGMSSEAIEHLLAEMRFAFPEAAVTGYQPLIDSLECDPKDRHVLAAAVRSAAGALVTFNIRDFPATSVDRFAIDVLHPSEFLLDLLDLAPRLVINELTLQATSNSQQPKTLPQLLDTLGRSGAEPFAEEVRQRSGTSNLVAGRWHVRGR